jgi:hypothetical protein
MPPPPGSRFGAEQRIFAVDSTRATLTKMSTAGLIVSVTMSGTFYVSFRQFSPDKNPDCHHQSNVLSAGGQSESNLSRNRGVAVSL